MNLNISIHREYPVDFSIFLDDDRIPGRDFIRMHADAHKNGEHVVLGNRKDVDLPEEIISEMIISGEFYDKLRSDAKEEKLLFKYRSPNNFFRWIYFYTGNLSVRKKHLKATGLFDENMKKWGHEDVDLGIRFFFEGIPFITRNDIVNYHILHENSLTERGESSLASLRYLKKKCLNGGTTYNLICRAPCRPPYIRVRGNLLVRRTWRRFSPWN